MAQESRHLHWIGNPYLGKRARIAVHEPEGPLPGALYSRLIDGSYERPIIVDEGDERLLCFRLDGCVQTVMDRRDPDALLCKYTRKMVGFLLFNPRPARILMIGLGGGSLVRWCRRHLPDAAITVCEIDPSVIALRNEFQIPPDDERLEVLLVDGATYLATCTDKFDVILVDAFDRDGLSLSVMTRSFYRDAKERLAAGGTFVMNAVDSLVLSKPCIDGMRAAFPRPIVPVSIPLDGNLILFGFESPISPGVAQRALGQALSVREALALTFPSMCRQLTAILRNAAPPVAT